MNNTGNIPPTGAGALYAGTANYDYPNFTGGISETLQTMIQNRFVQRLDALLKGIGTDYITTDSFSTFTNGATFASIPLNKTVWRTTTGSKFEKTGTNTMTKRSTDNGELARLGLQGSGATFTFNSNLYNKVKVNTGDISATTIQNPSNFGVQEVGEVFLIGVTAGASDVAVTWGDVYGTFNGSTFGAMPATSIPSQMTIYFKFRVITPSVETVKFQYVDGGGGGGGGGIDTLSSYTALRAYTGTSRAVVVRDFTYTFDAKTWTTIGGIFVRSTSGTENGSTLIVATNGIKWARQWDKVNFIPDWFEVGGRDHAGVAYTSKYTSAGGIYNDADRLNSANELCSTLKANLSLMQRTYLVDETVTFKADMVKGNEATIKTSTDIFFKTTLTAGFTSGGTTITVADASNYRVGQHIMVTLVSTTDGGFGDGESIHVGLPGGSTARITNITGNVITFTGTTYANAPIGSRVGLLCTHAIAPGIIVENLTFDGSWDGDYTASSDYTTFEWNFNNFVSQTSYPHRGDVTLNNNVYNQVKWRNHPGTCINGQNSNFTNCAAHRIGGAFFHQGTGSGHDINQNSMFVTGLIADSIGLVPRWLCDHQEALFCLSNYCRNIHINNVHATNLAGQVMGDMGYGNDFSLTIENSTFEGLYISGHPDASYPKRTFRAWVDNTSPEIYKGRSLLSISNCEFINTGDIEISYLVGTSLAAGTSVANLSFDNCKFVNIRMYGFQAGNISVNRCVFREVPGLGTFPGFSAGIKVQGYIRTGMLNFVWCDKVSVNDCYIEGSPVHNPFLNYGILYDPQNIFREDSTGANTKIYYGTDIKFTNNIVKGVSYGIGFSSDPDANNNGYPAMRNAGLHLGCKIEGNTIQMERHADDPGSYSNRIWGIFSLPGVDVINNTVILPDSMKTSGLGAFGIIALGTTVGESTRLAGWTVDKNKIYNDVGTGTRVAMCFEQPHFSTATYNTIARDNVYAGTLQGITNHYISGFKVQDHFPITTPYRIPDESYWLKNTNQY